jgi:hypothetical protein
MQPQDNSYYVHTPQTKSSVASRYLNNYEYHHRNNLSFLMWAFEDALIRYNSLKLITAECVVEEDSFTIKQQTAHRTPFLVSDRDNYYCPVLMATHGRVKRNGLRKNENAGVTTLLTLDFDSETDFEKAECIAEESDSELTFDYVMPTGGRGVQCGYRIDCYPVNTEENRKRYKAILQALCNLFNSDSKATLWTQLLRIPATPSAKTGRYSSCFVRAGSKKNSYGKLQRIESVLIRLGYLAPKKGKREGVDYKQKRKEIVGFLKRQGGSVETSISEMVTNFLIPERSIFYLLGTLERRGVIKRELLRNGQRNKGIRLTLLPKNEEKTEEVPIISHPANIKERLSTVVCFVSGGRHYRAVNVIRLAFLNGLPSMNPGYSCRNSCLFTSALGDFSAGLCWEQSRRELWAGNLRLKHPLSELEFETTFNSAYSGRYSGPTLHYLNKLREKLKLEGYSSSAGID